MTIIYYLSHIRAGQYRNERYDTLQGTVKPMNGDGYLAANNWTATACAWIVPGTMDA